MGYYQISAYIREEYAESIFIFSSLEIRKRKVSKKREEGEEEEIVGTNQREIEKQQRKLIKPKLSSFKDQENQ